MRKFDKQKRQVQESVGRASEYVEKGKEVAEIVTDEVRGVAKDAKGALKDKMGGPFSKLMPERPEADGPTKVFLEYSTKDGETKSEVFDYLVVACDPRALAIKDRTEFEKRVKKALTSFTFRTSLYKAKRPERPQLKPGDPEGPREDKANYAVRFNPVTLEPMDGKVYGFRDEVFARSKDLTPDESGVTWATTYQLEDKALIGRNEARVEKKLNELRDAMINADSGPERDWIDWHPTDSDQPENDALVDYFAHFNEKDLDDGLPWLLRDHQGEKNTIYVSSFTCFESVLHCYLYEDELMNPEGDFMKRNVFPTDKNARFAVVGAGPSGLLFASQHLKNKGYNNFTIFEKLPVFGGKTLTVHKEAPTGGWDVPCELGTCYLSPAYEPMLHLFSDYDAGKVVALDRDSTAFRSIIAPDVAENEEETENGVEYGRWTWRRNGKIEAVQQARIVFATIKYLVIHWAVMGIGINDAMPEKSPEQSTVLGNLRDVIRDALEMGHENRGRLQKEDADDEDGVDMEAMYNAVKNKKRDQDKTTMNPRGLFDNMDGLNTIIANTFANIAGLDDDSTDAEQKDALAHLHALRLSKADLESATSDVFTLTFGEFLKKHDLEVLRGLFIYGYQVQGYGTIDRIPTYYGLIWLTPAIFLANIKMMFDPPEAGTPAAERGTVNIVTTGWRTLWEKIVEKDLGGKLVYDATITSIERRKVSS